MTGQQQVSGSQWSDEPRAASRTNRSAELSRWVQDHRPPFRTTERSWFVMGALLSFGLAVFVAPALFITVGIGSSVLAWWRRESARQGVLNTAFVAFFAGVALLLVSIVLYVIQNL